MVLSIASYPLFYINKDTVSYGKRMALRRHVFILREEMPFLFYNELFINIFVPKYFNKTKQIFQLMQVNKIMILMHIKFPADFLMTY